MTKKKKKYLSCSEKLKRPWCYYCERDFDDLKILISHQKAKHFKCDRCGRRLNTAGGLSVHMNQVHKETLTHVENANPGRQGLEIEIFGMEGVPQDILDQHNNQVTEAHWQEEQERARITGNPMRGLFPNGTAPPNKRPKVKESLEDIEKRVDKYREDRKNGVLPEPTAPAVQDAALTPPAGLQAPYGAPPGMPAQPGYPPANGGIPPRPDSIPGQLPARPGFGAPPGAQNGADSIQASLDDLIAGVQKETSAPDASAKKEEKKSKKDKNMRLIYHDDTISPEEKMARLPRFAEYVRV